MAGEIDFYVASENDIAMIVDQRTIFSDSLAGQQSRETEKQMRALFTAYLQKELNKTYLTVYAKSIEEVVSIAGLVIRTQPGNLKNPSGIWGYIMNVYTAPLHRKKGLSKKVLNLLIDEARSRGVTAFELHATKEGEPAYIANGFEIHNEPTYRKYFNQ